jgi:hypothetical protein
MTAVWNDFKSFFVDGWHSAVYLVEQAWLGLGASFSTSMGGLMMVGSKLVDGLTSLFAGLARAVGGSFLMIETTVKGVMLRLLKVAEVAFGGTGNFVAARLLERAQNEINALPSPAAELESGIRAAEGAAADLSAELRGTGIGMLGKDATREQLEAHKRFQREQAAREAARKADAQAAAGEVAAAEQRLQNLRLGAAIAASFRGGGAGGAGAGGGTPDPTAAMGAVRGVFAGFGNLAQSLGGGGPTREVTKRLDKVIEKTDEEIRVMEDVARALGDMGGGVVWGV